MKHIGTLSGRSEGELRSFVADLAQDAPLDTLRKIAAAHLLDAAREDLHHQIAVYGRSSTFGSASLAASIRTSFFESAGFRDWVDAERSLGRRVLWITDLDKAMAAGDSFVHFLDWRRRNGMFSKEQGRRIAEGLHNSGAMGHGLDGKDFLDSVSASTPAQNLTIALQLWMEHERTGNRGLSLLQLWDLIYWPSLVGTTPAEKRDLVAAFAPEYGRKIFPGVREANVALRNAGVDVVIVTNGDGDIAQAIAPLFNIDPRNVCGCRPAYEAGRATGEVVPLEINSIEARERPDPVKFLQLGRWVMSEEAQAQGFSGDALVVAGFDGDSPGPDGGAMLFMRPKLGYFTVNTPGEHDSQRIVRFQKFVATYAHWHADKFVALHYEEPESGPFPDLPV